MSQPGDDAQRDMEQRALRNVRGLLDKIEDDDRHENRKTIRIAIACGVAVIVAFALIFAVVARNKSSSAGSVVIPAPAKAIR